MKFLRSISGRDGRTITSLVKAMARYPAEFKIAIGNWGTDINMELAADLVLAYDCLEA